MGRISQARRRAALEETATLSLVPMPHAPEDIDFSALVGASFGAEQPDRQEAETELPPVVQTRPAAEQAAVAEPPPAVSPEPEAPPAPVLVQPGVPAPALERIDARFAEKTVIDDRTEPVSREQYRRIGAVLHEAQGASGVNVIMIASAVAGEGKTLTAINLALTLSESYRKRVLLIDGDLRRPALHQAFGLEPSGGLVDALSADHADLLVSDVSPTLAIMAGGEPTSDPMADLTSDRMRRVIAEAKRAFDWVVIDTPPVVLLPDAHVLASIVDGVVLVVRAESTPHALIARAVESVGRARILGVVLNNARSDLREFDGKYYRNAARVTP